MDKQDLLNSVIKLIEAKKGAVPTAPTTSEQEQPKTPEPKEDRSISLVSEIIQKMKNKDKVQ